MEGIKGRGERNLVITLLVHYYTSAHNNHIYVYGGFRVLV